jgi:toxin ParE1/3/4
MLVITTQATRDLQDIWEYIAEDNLRRADEFLEQIFEQFSLITDMPGVGRKRDELSPGLRSFPIGRYIIFYRRKGQTTIEITRVLGGERDLEALL